MNQGQIFPPTILDALAADVRAVGVKKMAKLLYPEKDEESAVKTLLNALNPDQPHKLCPEQVMVIKRKAAQKKSFATVTFEANELNLRFLPVNPEDELVVLLREFLDRKQNTEQRIERLIQQVAETRPQLFQQLRAVS